MDDILQALKSARKDKNLKQAELGGKLGLPQSHISKIEQGITDPRLSTIRDMARMLDLELILVPRETPLSLTVLDNMKRAAEYGAVILPAMPGFYHGVKTISDLIDFVVSRILDQLGIRNSLIHRWGAEE